VADLRIFNPDGSEAELSGNGAREAILYLRRHWTELDTFAIHTVAGEIRPTITGPDTCRVDMGYASLTSKDFPAGPADGLGAVISAGRLWPFRHVSIGNPQCAIAVESMAELESLDLPAIGPAIEAAAQFPNRTNVSWFTELKPGSPGAIRARIFERGVGETLSSGTGATGAAVAHAEKYPIDLRPTTVTVHLDGGELVVDVGEDLHVNLTGWARAVFEGRLSDEFEKELHETE
jgi:diaminopimelate epimerase